MTDGSWSPSTNPSTPRLPSGIQETRTYQGVRLGAGEAHDSAGILATPAGLSEQAQATTTSDLPSTSIEHPSPAFHDSAESRGKRGRSPLEEFHPTSRRRLQKKPPWLGCSPLSLSLWLSCPGVSSPARTPPPSPSPTSRSLSSRHFDQSPCGEVQTPWGNGPMTGGFIWYLAEGGPHPSLIAPRVALGVSIKQHLARGGPTLLKRP
ncbi:hypothetical protein CCHR01_15332 [Colletotrichum chrysophilum]|uniref:Uncharacterized protein n=1 Tax=Colletotrichum chrysophilum TaxID=1836956 RepID=A0AAD9E8S9_9PEZI|nr:hypothetical protein CCHR01_15332 [Colletotrichum chrysophilum]